MTKYNTYRICRNEIGEYKIDWLGPLGWKDLGIRKSTKEEAEAVILKEKERAEVSNWVCEGEY